MPTYIQPIVLIDEGQLTYVPRAVNAWCGPVSYGGDLWVFGLNGLTGGDPHALIYRSTDSGATWDVQDYDNAPHVNWVSGCYDSEATDLWHAACVLTGDYTTCHFRTFDFSTCAWGADWSTVALGTDPGSPEGQIALEYYPGTSPAEFVFVWYAKNGSTRTLSFKTYSGGSWSASHEIDKDESGAYTYEIKALAIDGSGRTHLFVLKYGIYSLTGDLLHFILNTDGTCSAATTAVSGAHTNDKYLTAIIRDDEVILSRYAYSAYESGVVRGTPLSAPVFSYETVVGEIDGWNPAFPTLAVSIDRDYSTYYLFWAQGGDLVRAKQWYASNDGTGWSDPVMFYDAEADPPTLPEDYVLRDLEQVSATIFGGSWVGIAQGGLLETPTVTACNILFYDSGGLGIASPPGNFAYFGSPSSGAVTGRNRGWFA